ncbi:MAG: acylglycerol kinase family protein, partial [Bacteroidota bacterium]
MTSAPWLFIVNPAADRGRAEKRWQKMLPKLKVALPNMKWLLTSTPQEAIDLTQTAVANGQRYIAAVGGDGTHHEVVNGIYRALGIEKSAEVTYALLPLGSGNDWRRTHRIPCKLEPWLKMMAGGHSQQQNLGLIDYWYQGQQQQRVFANVAGFAYDAYVTRRASEAQLRGPILYPLFT